MQLYKYDTSHDGTHRQAKDRSVDAALLVEKLVEIYNTPTPMGWRKAGKVIVLIDCVCVCCFYNSQGTIFIPET